ncbi:NADH:flavin oxidoreductase [Acinetobacter proteolyticus]|uniref:NADH:flavin oxidoreductase n=1 Tax=Acinetobacter proteolyticus TaxID=1776741 RepID=UPI0031DD575B
MSSNFILENPIYFGSLKVSGRVFKTATHETLATDEGFMTDEILDFYRPMAESKLPLIITGNIFVSWQGKSGGKQLALDHDDKILGMKKLADMCHKYGTKLIAQINHGGSQMRSSAEGITDYPVTSTGRLHPTLLGISRSLKIEEFPDLIKSYADAAERAQKAGCDGVQIQMAHGYLISQFLAPYTNRRNDLYGGNLDNRMRLPLQIVKAIRQCVGDDFPILAKVNGTDALAFRRGATTDELVTFAVALQNEGVDAIEISRAHYESVPPMLSGSYHGFLKTNIEHGSGMGFSSTRKKMALSMSPMIESFLTWSAPKGEGYNMPYVKHFKHALDIPVIASGGFVSREVMENALINGHSDAISCARAFIADPYLYHNLYHSEFDYPICQYCNKCIARLGGMAVDCYEPEMSKKRQIMLDTDILF